MHQDTREPIDNDPATTIAEPSHPAWMAVFSLAAGVFGLLTAEYLPASLLTPIAASFAASEALAGQSVTATAIAALLAGLLLPGITRRLDRRVIMLACTGLMIVSNILVALAPGLYVVLAMRVLLGLAVGGFWSMAPAVAMRLVPARQIPRALSIVFSGISVGTVVSVPLGSWLGSVLGWRSAFWVAALLGICTLAFQWLALPRMTARRSTRTDSVAGLLRRPGIAIGMAGCILAHTGQYVLFTYIRPMLEAITPLDVEHLAWLLLGFGAANFAGTLLAGSLLERSLRLTLIMMPAVICATALGLETLPLQRPGLSLLVALWGMAFGGIPVAWSSWVARALPDQAESAGGMVVAAVQSSIAAGATLGGIAFRFGGTATVLLTGSMVMGVAAIVIALAMRRQAAELEIVRASTKCQPESCVSKA